MPITLFFSHPLFFILWLFAILIALTVHEFAHALAAYVLGDTTAKDYGRLTLNPKAHIDPVGLLLLIFVGFGWGKPVPFNPYALRLRRVGGALVGMAGPVSNFLIALGCGVFLMLLKRLALISPDNLSVQLLSFLIIINIMLMAFNLIPIPPLDGSKVLLAFLSSPRYEALRFTLETRGPLFLILLIFLDRFTGISIFDNLFQGALKLAEKIMG